MKLNYRNMNYKKLNDYEYLNYNDNNIYGFETWVDGIEYCINCCKKLTNNNISVISNRKLNKFKLVCSKECETQWYDIMNV